MTTLMLQELFLRQELKFDSSWRMQVHLRVSENGVQPHRVAYCEFQLHMIYIILVTEHIVNSENLPLRSILPWLLVCTCNLVDPAHPGCAAVRGLSGVNMYNPRCSSLRSVHCRGVTRIKGQLTQPESVSHVSPSLENLTGKPLGWTRRVRFNLPSNLQRFTLNWSLEGANFPDTLQLA